ncbi:GlsB/YeaQ/YmgE family stress response membrane protein [Pseudaminobacter soli (ex Li et al. 2025)]|uniref:GlsB/YeaQ/YmgE family stress response membrane protein n=1 Tax=Pseudaminobacter soli (ex Li et al. 2025) TaxID=1295366 RepID=A0A2P7RMG5_9HYPH|nr:GlsB/YeaQ/YmgE family stress response membrane protein [Mesorhizobium soli]PSJ51375.1 GlsB/YeaQ/YmgE family stress response membrane protein [Mesorhizobium soli]
MLVIGWIALGLLAGLMASSLVYSTGQGILVDIALGIVGAVMGGVMFNFFGAAGVTGFNIWSLIVALIGAVVLLWLYHGLVGRRPGSAE